MNRPDRGITFRSIGLDSCASLLVKSSCFPSSFNLVKAKAKMRAAFLSLFTYFPHQNCIAHDQNPGILNVRTSVCPSVGGHGGRRASGRSRRGVHRSHKQKLRIEFPQKHIFFHMEKMRWADGAQLNIIRVPPLDKLSIATCRADVLLTAVLCTLPSFHGLAANLSLVFDRLPHRRSPRLR